MRQLNLRITSRAKQHIERILRWHPVGSLPALIFGRMDTYSKDGELKEKTDWHFSINVYPKEQAEQIARDLSANGHDALYQVEDLVLFIPQATVVTEQVEGATLDVQDDAVRIV